MKRLSRDFTRGEKALLLLLALILLGLAYYLVVDRPVRSALESARAEKEAIVTELTALQGRIARMEKMEQELKAIRANPGVSRMGSYNNSKAELDFLNELLDETDEYTVNFTVTADDGYRFPLMDGAPDVRSFVNGKPAETRSVDGYDKKMVIKVSLTFPTVKEPEAPESGSDIGNFKITGIKNKTYTGKALTQNITVKDPEGHALTEDVDFIVTYKNNTDVGTAYAVITSAGDYEGFFIKTFKITKAKNPVRVAAKKSVTANSKKATTIKKAVAVTKAQGKVTYKTDNKMLASRL